MSTTGMLEFEYAAPPEAVSRLMQDAAFRESVCRAQHATSCTVTVEAGAVAINYTQAVRGIPSFAAKVVGDSVEIQQRETWSGQTATFSLTLPGKPGEITGTRSLTASASGATETFTLAARVSMPLIGGRLESLILQIFTRAAEREHRTALATLSAGG